MVLIILSNTKIIVRAGYFMNMRLSYCKVAHTIAAFIASGFSLLTYLLASGNQSNVQFVDVDLPDMIDIRQARIKKNSHCLI